MGGEGLRFFLESRKKQRTCLVAVKVRLIRLEGGRVGCVRAPRQVARATPGLIQ